MKFTLSWLKEHLETDASLDDILYALTDLGLEVEEVVNPLDKLDAFTIGYVKHAEKHPDADKLNVCTVDTGEGDLQIICGAPNARTLVFMWLSRNRGRISLVWTSPLRLVKFAVLNRMG